MKKDHSRPHAPKPAVVTTTETPTGLTGEEERVLRMRSGARLRSDEPLGSKLDGVAPAALGELSARLRLMEAAALESLMPDDDDDVGESDVEAANVEADLPFDGARKARIIAALRKKPQ